MSRDWSKLDHIVFGIPSYSFRTCYSARIRNDANIIDDTASIVCGAESMKRHGVRPSVCPSTGPQQQTRCRRFAAVDISIDCCSSGGGGRTRAVPRYQRTQVAEHRLVNSKIVQYQRRANATVAAAETVTFTPPKLNVRYGSTRSLASPDMNTFLTPSRKFGSTEAPHRTTRVLSAR